MRAALLKEVGLKPVIEVIDVDDPVAGDENVVIKVEAVGLCNHDVAVMKGILRRGVKENIILGHEISGTIVDTGIVGDGFSLGDRVVTSLTNFCGECESCLTGVIYRCPNAYGYGHGIDGGFREYLAIHPRNLIKVDPSSNVVGSKDSIYSITAFNSAGCKRNTNGPTSESASAPNVLLTITRFAIPIPIH